MFGTYSRLHLSPYATPREVIEAVRRRFKPTARRNPRMRAARHLTYRQMLDHHVHAQELCMEFAL